MSDRLYGQPGAEYMEFDPGAVWEQIECDGDQFQDGRWIIEEWSVREPRRELPQAVDITDRLLEYELEELTENVHDDWKHAVDDEVLAAFDAALNLWASKIATRMADELVAEHVVTIVDGVVLYDGEPMYRDRPPDA